MSLKKLLIFLLPLAVLYTACTENSDKLTPLERQAVDKRYTGHIKELRPILDSICQVQKDSLILQMADSLVNLRMEEIDKIMNR